jgi:hypothetical protein
VRRMSVCSISRFHLKRPHEDIPIAGVPMDLGI